MNDRDAVIRRGRAAEIILKDETVMKAFGELEADLVTEWAASNPTNTDGREAIYRQVKAMEMFQGRLESWMANGKMELANAERTLRDQKGTGVEA